METPKGTVMETPKGTVRVQREGGRGHHLIDEANYDPKVHVLCDEAGKAVKGSAKSDGSDDEKAALRETYQARFGKKPYMGWDAGALREKLAEEKAANGLTRRELNADLESMDIEPDPTMGIEDLAELRDMARADRDK